jgi:hypothetical protein
MRWKADAWQESDGSAGLRGYLVKSDKYAEAKAILSCMISAGAGAFPQTTTLLSSLGGATQINSGGIENAFSAGLQAGGEIYSKRLLEQLDKNRPCRSPLRGLRISLGLSSLS